MLTLSVLKVGFKEVVKEMWGACTSKGMLVVYFWLLVIFWAITGMIRGNICVWFGFVAGVAVLLGIVIYYSVIISFFEFLHDWLMMGSGRTDSFCKAYRIGRYSPGWVPMEPITRHDMLWFIICLGMLPLLSSFVIFVPPTNEREYAIVGSSVLPIDSRFVLSQPLEKVLWINKEQTIVAEKLIATTKDGVLITADIEANLKLEADRGSIPSYANKRDQIEKELKDRLQVAFTLVVAGHTVETLPNDLLILSNLVH